MYLDKKQLRMLRKLNRKPITRTEKTYDPVLDYLISLELAQCTQVDKPGDYMYHAWITQPGKAFLYDHFQTSVKTTAAIVISIVSAVFSVLALMLSVLSSLDDLIANWNLLVSVLCG